MNEFFPYYFVYEKQDQIDLINGTFSRRNGNFATCSALVQTAATNGS
jgi:hypothetical protein